VIRPSARRGLDPDRHRRVLVQAPNWLGDFVMATPIFRRLREVLPDAHLALLARSYLRPVIDGAPWFDAFLASDEAPEGSKAGKKTGDRGTRGVLRNATRLRRERFDLAILLTNSFRTALTVRLAGIPERVGTELQGRGWLLTHGYRPPMATRAKRVAQPMPDSWFDLLESFGLPRGDDRMELFVPEETRERGRRLLESFGVGDGDRLVALNPGASFGSSKLWSPDSFAVVGDALAADGAKVAVLFGPGEEALAARIRDRMRAPAIDGGRRVTLDLLKPFFERCDLVVTTDAGPRHVAVAMGCPVVCVIGPTDPRYSATNLARTTVLREEVDCAPCHLKTCPIDHRCMTRLLPERVIAAARERLERGRRGDGRPPESPGA